MTKRDQILKTALDVILEFGLQATPMSLLAKKAGTGMGTIYHHFENKEELVLTLYTEIWEHINSFTLNGYQKETPVRERMFFILNNYMDYCLKFPKQAGFIAQYSHVPYIMEKFMSAEDGLYVTLFHVFEEGQTQQIIKSQPIPVLVKFVHGAISSVVHGGNLGKFEITDEIVNATISSCWDAIRV